MGDPDISELEQRRRDLGDKLGDPGKLTVAQVAELSTEMREIDRKLSLLSSRGWHALGDGLAVSPKRIL